MHVCERECDYECLSVSSSVSVIVCVCECVSVFVCVFYFVCVCQDCAVFSAENNVFKRNMIFDFESRRR